jgi:hypothetical protein
VKFLKTILALGLALSLCTNASAFEKKQPKDVDISAMTNETQRTSYAGGVHLAWWIPPEYWEASLSRDANVTDTARKQVLDTLRGYSMLAVVQAEVGALGNFTFYERDAVIKGLKLELSDGKDWASLVPLAEVPQKLAPLLKVLGPILSSAMGPMGQNMNFFVLDDQKKGGRLISPYEPGMLRITLTDNKGVKLEPLLIEFPLDSLYVPRRCPNGKPAHVSWMVCPWDGSKLPQ